MRIWDVSPSILCRQHLLGEHRELHALWTILRENKKGYRNHPETKRWEGKLPALFLRHELLVGEMKKRGYKHMTPLDLEGVKGSKDQAVMLAPLDQQISLLTAKECPCPLDGE